MASNFRFILEKGSKKHLCPGCGKKSFVRYIDTIENKYLPDQYGRCDHESHCGYYKMPPLETRCFFVPFSKLVDYSSKSYLLENNEGKYYIPKSQVYEVTANGCYVSEYILNAGNKKSPHHITTDCKSYSESGSVSIGNLPTLDKPECKPVYFLPEAILNATLKDYEKNTFIRNILKLAPLEVIERVISLYRVGTIGKGSRAGAVTFPYIDISGNIRTIQAKQFDDKNHTVSTDFVHSILDRNYQKEAKQLPAWLQDYLGNEKFVTCLFGEHLLNKFPMNPIALVEAPKTAIIGTLYYGLPDTPSNLLWLAVYNKSSLSFDKCKALKGRKVVLFPDLNAFDEWSKKSNELASKLPGTRFITSDILEKNASEEEKSDALDLADYLIRFKYSQFRTNYLEREAPPVIAPDPPVIQHQASEPPPGQKPDNEKSEKHEDVKQSFFAELNKSANSPYFKERESWTTDLQSLESFFSTTQLPDSPLRLDQCTIIHHLPTFISGHLAILHRNNGNPVFLPYLNRLKQIQQILKTSITS